MNENTETQTGQNIYDNNDEGISLSELLKIFKHHFKWFLFGFFLVVGMAVVYLQLAIPQYESGVSVLVDPIQKSSSIENLLESSASSTKIATEVELITSRKNIEFALSTLDLDSYKNAEGDSYSNREVLGNVKDRIVVSTVKDTNIVKIVVTDASPMFARDLANALASSYDGLLTGIAKNSKTAQREFIDAQIPINQKMLVLASDALGDFRENSDIIQLTDKSTLLVNEISYYKLRLEPLKLQMQEASVFIQNYNQGLVNAGIKGILTLDELGNDVKIKAKLKELNGWKTELTMYESLSSPQIGTSATSLSSNNSSRVYFLNSAIEQITKDLLDRVSVLTSAYANESNTQSIVQLLTTEVAIQVLEERGAQFTNELSQLPVLERQLSELQRDVQIYETIDLKLRDMLEEVKLVEAAVTGNVTVVDQANIPLNPVSPNKLLILAVALLLGCAVGLLFALGIEASDQTIRNEAQIKKLVKNAIPLLGWLPLMKVSPKDKYPMFSVFNDPLSFEAERFKLISNMLYNKHDMKVFSITSCSMAEGKSTIVANVALSLAQMGKKVLIIDGDLRLPSMERFFLLKHSESGLVDYVINSVPLERSIVQPLDSVPNLHLLSSGSTPLVPAAIFSNPNYIETLKHLKTLYDFIIIDAPPLDSASELLTISKNIDGLIITVRAGVTSKLSLIDLVDNLKTGNAPILGIVFNGCSAGTTNSGYHYGNYYNSYAYRYNSYQNNNSKKGLKLSNYKIQNSSGYRKKYRQNIRQRDNQKLDLSDTVLAFGPQSYCHSLHEWGDVQHFNPVTGIGPQHNADFKDGLEAIENDLESIGKL
ncbi:capsular exopolysaccharide biosynthesis protein [Sphaerochaeta pleomorpha str. Grapes]|uniref:non-specific protein-tyrosine kinase n=1 Tax=Sphaerochaeta pleomorpha (strain ATCC BAA-1885 / DSM 22778 / Grapes) TaxID=158190 RepID=G8QXQ5_SPHPG|nr:polysaccharide biosynthesis tyrosine autokinase [Sphaerochaeta pleomorpha]AEV30699.1 capsular exopolysaccharide biosynthesis protein [Sphaerochaeta pleomorpha str. Grapes]